MTNLKNQLLVFRPFARIVKGLIMLTFFFAFYSCGKSGANEPELIVEFNAPFIQTPAPLIHLADNLDEQDKLGWCIDTQGIGFNEDLHVHSCKPAGGDVQFYYNEETSQICSVEYVDFCIEMTGGPMAGMSLRLVKSDPNSSEQKFIYDEESGEFRPESNDKLCLAAGVTSAAAGRYMSRTLSLEIVSDTDVSLKKWVIVKEESTN